MPELTAMAQAHLARAVWCPSCPASLATKSPRTTVFSINCTAEFMA